MGAGWQKSRSQHETPEGPWLLESEHLSSLLFPSSTFVFVAGRDFKAGGSAS